MMADVIGLIVVLSVIGLAAAALAVTTFTLLRMRSTLRRNAGARSLASSKRDWGIETVDPIAGLRSSYKPEPMCERCLVVEHPGALPFFVCRLNERCGLLEDEQVSRR